MFPVKKMPIQWESDTILNGQTKNPNFVRTFWNESQSQEFGPWRLDAKSDPTDGLSKPHDNNKENHDQNEFLGENENSNELLDTEENLTVTPENSPNSEAEKNLSKEQLNLQIFSLTNQIKTAQQQGYVQGLKDGMTKALFDLESERNKDKEIISTLVAELQNILQDSFGQFEPLRKLALHIAEQLVRTELSISGNSIDRLVQACIKEINAQEKYITLSANSADIERIKPFLKDSGSEILMQVDNNLHQGSIRVRSNDTIIEDLIENRLGGLAKILISNPEEWLKKSSTLVGTDVDSIEPSEVELSKLKSNHEIDDATLKSVSSLDINSD
jgi:flagellar biosynthesis/type III secretory pathway protein FliH